MAMDITAWSTYAAVELAIQAAIVLAALALVLLAGCTHTAPGDSIRPGTAATAEQPARSGPGFDEPLLILVSLDGFHPDYLERGLTPAPASRLRRGMESAILLA